MTQPTALITRVFPDARYVQLAWTDAQHCYPWDADYAYPSFIQKEWWIKP